MRMVRKDASRQPWAAELGGRGLFEVSDWTHSNDT